MIERLRRRQEWAFFGALHRAAPGHAVAWWVGLVARGSLPAAIAVVSGWLIGAVTDGEPLTAPLVAMAVVFIAAQVVGPLHEAVGSSLGDRTATSLNDRLMAATLGPPGVAHLERADLANDLTMARDFDLGITGPPLSYAMNFIADGFVGLVSGIASAIVLAWYGWWQAVVLVLAWSATHWLLRESAVWRDRRTPEVQHAQRHAEYSYRLAVDPPAAKEIRLFGLADWVIDRFTAQRRRLYDLQYEATRLRERSVAACLVDRGRRQPAGVLVAGRSGGRRRPRPVGGDRRPAGRHRRERHRLRRAQLGARRCRRAGRRRGPAGGGDAAGRGAGRHRLGAGRPPAADRPGDPLPRRHRSATPAGRSCSTGST